MNGLREIYQVDAFADRPFSGNPAAICPLPRGAEWPSDTLLRAIAEENRLSETAYFRPSEREDADFDLRWFTPEVEVELCGHATLASAFVIFRILGFPGDTIRFLTRSGLVRVSREREGDLLTLDFPAREVHPGPLPAGLAEALGAVPTEAHFAANGMNLYVLSDEASVRRLRPDLSALARMKASVLVTARADGPNDFVSRYFAPHYGVPEDPVTGSAHCVLTPFWARRLGKNSLQAYQASARGGTLYCKPHGDRVLISGRARLFFRGELVGLD